MSIAMISNQQSIYLCHLSNYFVHTKSFRSHEIISFTRNHFVHTKWFGVGWQDGRMGVNFCY